MLISTPDRSAPGQIRCLMLCSKLSVQKNVRKHGRTPHAAYSITRFRGSKPIVSGGVDSALGTSYLGKPVCDATWYVIKLRDPVSIYHNMEFSASMMR